MFCEGRAKEARGENTVMQGGLEICGDDRVTPAHFAGVRAFGINCPFIDPLPGAMQ